MLNVKSNGTSHSLCEETQYSTTEAVYTGRKWIDGKKIYSIVTNASIKNSSDFMSLTFNLPTDIASNIDTIVDSSAIWHVGGLSVTIPRAHRDSNNDGISLAYNSDHNIWLNWGEKNSGGTLTVITYFTLSEE